MVPVEEQRAIADFLDRETAKIDALAEQKRALALKLGEKRSALISRTVKRGLLPDAARLDPHPKLKPTGVECVGEVPEHWGAAQLRRALRFITSGSRDWAEHYADAGSVFVRIGNLTRHSLRLDLSEIQHVVPPEGVEGERTRICAGEGIIDVASRGGCDAVRQPSKHVHRTHRTPTCSYALTRANANIDFPEGAATWRRTIFVVQRTGAQTWPG